MSIDDGGGITTSDQKHLQRQARAPTPPGDFGQTKGQTQQENRPFSVLSRMSCSEGVPKRIASLYWISGKLTTPYHFTEPLQ